LPNHFDRAKLSRPRLASFKIESRLRLAKAGLETASMRKCFCRSDGVDHFFEKHLYNVKKCPELLQVRNADNISTNIEYRVLFIFVMMAYD